jgi:hypothetical protein
MFAAYVRIFIFIGVLPVALLDGCCRLLILLH